MDNELEQYYALLGVASGTSGQELKEAYRDLAKVWHPDRFSHDPRLQQKAQEKLKEINEAYEHLTSARLGRRTRSSSTPREPHVPAATAVRRKRPRLVLLTAVVFCAVFFAALRSLVPSGAHPAPEQTPPARLEETQPSGEAQQPEGGTGAAAVQPMRGRERTVRQRPSEAAPGGDPNPGPSAQELRPIPTVTVTIDAATGQLATPDCPTVSRMTYPAGREPRQYCTAPHKTKVAVQAEPPRTKGSRLKSIGARLAAPFKRLGGERGTEAGEMRDAQPAGDRPENR